MSALSQMLGAEEQNRKLREEHLNCVLARTDRALKTQEAAHESEHALEQDTLGFTFRSEELAQNAALINMLAELVQVCCKPV